MNFKHLRILACAIALAALPLADAFAQVDIVKGAGGKAGVDLSALRAAGGAPSAQALRTIQADLQRSGLVKLEAAGRATYRVAGSIADSPAGVSIRCTVSDLGGRVLLNQAFAQPRFHVAAHQAAQAIVKAVTGKDSFLTARLAAIGVVGNTKKVHVSDYAMLAPVPIWNNPAICLKPRWSPDNRILSFTSYAQRFPDVYTYELATGSIQRAAHYPGVNSGGAISPDGRSMALVLSKDGNPDLYVLDLPTRRLTRLTNTPRGTEGSPCWSPDGSRIAYVANTTGVPQIYIISKNGGTPVRLTSDASQSAAPDWGKNGLIAYQVQKFGRFQIAIADPATKASRLITNEPGVDYEDPSWAPDGRHLAAARVVNYRSAIYLLDTEGDDPVALTTSGDWRAPAWSR